MVLARKADALGNLFQLTHFRATNFRRDTGSVCDPCWSRPASARSTAADLATTTTTFYYLLLPSTTFYYLLLPSTTFYYLLLPSTTFYYPLTGGDEHLLAAQQQIRQRTPRPHGFGPARCTGAREYYDYCYDSIL